MRRLLAVLLLLLATFAFAQPGRNEHDDDFVDAMILHHRHGIVLARVAAERAKSDELRALARTMIDRLERDIFELEPMRDHGEAPERAELMNLPGMTLADPATLRAASDAAFDTTFVAVMTQHLGGGIELARSEVARGADARPKRKARALVERQSAERDALRAAVQ